MEVKCSLSARRKHAGWVEGNRGLDSYQSWEWLDQLRYMLLHVAFWLKALGRF